MKHEEYHLQKGICTYLSMQYPEVMFLSDTVASVKLTPMQASRNKSIQKNGFKCPDLIILEPRGRFCGLFIELKTDTPFKKNGAIKASQKDHLELQNRTLVTLSAKGYSAQFAWSFDMAKAIIDEYLKLPSL
ncbi:PDDEXK family nuclease [Flavobacterium macacae]|uniref:VRR-NUC domain-containing protein n=1 Tax=Flavobacterium macacae TaxID=2488993 RepID=A0A3P3VYA4_9FLAO|nr:hypothetical protein [Flavobacterium macacae]RRJ87785.1 hypothetical protein EG849_15080 [Flavobacterium macacae]